MEGAGKENTGSQPTIVFVAKSGVRALAEM